MVEQYHLGKSGRRTSDRVASFEHQGVQNRCFFSVG